MAHRKCRCHKCPGGQLQGDGKLGGKKVGRGGEHGQFPRWDPDRVLGHDSFPGGWGSGIPLAHMYMDAPPGIVTLRAGPDSFWGYDIFFSRGRVGR